MSALVRFQNRVTGLSVNSQSTSNTQQHLEKALEHEVEAAPRRFSAGERCEVEDCSLHSARSTDPGFFSTQKYPLVRSHYGIPQLGEEFRKCGNGWVRRSISFTSTSSHRKRDAPSVFFPAVLFFLLLIVRWIPEGSPVGQSAFLTCFRGSPFAPRSVSLEDFAWLLLPSTVSQFS